jgi:hypothetical protein
MTLAIVLVNVVLVAVVVGAMLALHGWAIATDAGRQARQARVRRAPRVRPAGEFVRARLATR